MTRKCANTQLGRLFRTALGRYLVQNTIQSTINTQGIGRRPRDAHRKMVRAKKKLPSY